MTYYTSEFAEFFERYFTGWVRNYSPRLADYLKESSENSESVLDLCCGTGVTASVLCNSGWNVFGVDRSKGMLRIAAEKLDSFITEGTLTLVEADARDFQLPKQVDAAICLDGALNHLDSVDELIKCFLLVNKSLVDGGQFIFDVFEVSHLRHWDNLTLVDEPELMIAKRGVWDLASQTGMLRVSGTVEAGEKLLRVNQTLRSRYYDQKEIVAAIEASGLRPVEHDIEASYVKCESGSCSKTSAPCRTIYRAIKV